MHHFILRNTLHVVCFNVVDLARCVCLLHDARDQMMSLVTESEIFQDSLCACGVIYDMVSNIPKVSQNLVKFFAKTLFNA